MSLPRGSDVRDYHCEVSPGSRPGKDASPKGAGESGGYAVADLHSNSVPSVQIASIMTASLRATAT